jgi:serine/threonine protein kinase
MQDLRTDQLVAVKQMPNAWIGMSHDEFVRANPNEREVPWQDLGCSRFLNSINFEYACHLHGVYRNDHHTFVVSTAASEGDLFAFALNGEPLGRKREASLAPLVIQLFSALQELHELQIVHGDISLENVLVTRATDGTLQVLLTDYSMAAIGQRFRNRVRGKASYQAPEMFTDAEYDGFLSDTFAAGIVLYAFILRDYPWVSTEPGRCKSFEYCNKHGLRAFCASRFVQGTQKRLGSCVSEALMQLMEGMLTTDPSKRLTLGEQLWTERSSVWDEPWIARFR